MAAAACRFLSKRQPACKPTIRLTQADGTFAQERSDMLDITDPQQILAKLATVDQTITVEQAAQFVAVDCVIREAESLPYGGTHYGPEGFVHLVHTVFGLWQDCTLDIRNVWTDGIDRMIHYSQMSGHTGKGAFSMPMVEYYRVVDGKMAEITILYFDTKLLADLAG
jgi:hypothetical protein